MGTLFWYQFRLLAFKTLGITAVLTVILWLTMSLRFIEAVVGNGFSLQTFFVFILLLLPFFLSTLLPIAAVAALLFTYARLEQNNEITIMRSSGLTPLKIAMPALVLGIVLTGFGYGLTLKWMPESYKKFKDMEYVIQRGDFTAFIETGKFSQLGKDITVHIKNRREDGTLEGIFISDHRDKQRVSTLSAATGVISSTPQGAVIKLEKGSRTELDEKGGAFSSLSFEEYTLDLASFTDMAINRYKSIGEQKLDELFNPQDVHPTFAAEMRAEAHSRITHPLFFFGFLLVAACLFLSAGFARVQKNIKIYVAVAAVAALNVLALATKFLSAKFPELTPLMYAVPTLPIVVSLVVLVKGSLPRRPKVVEVV